MKNTFNIEVTVNPQPESNNDWILYGATCDFLTAAQMMDAAIQSGEWAKVRVTRTAVILEKAGK